MEVSLNSSLKEYNSFGINAKAKKLITVTSTADLKQVLQQTYASELFILGGGSNMLLTRDLDKTVVHINLKGKEILSESDTHVIIKSMAGENWHKFVLYTLNQNFGGLENLSLIPGNVGTSPIQNIGAYGVELKDVFHSCEAINIQTLEEKTFSLEECGFGYRNSVFKQALKGEYIITSVNFKLTKKEHNIKIEYGAIKSELDALGIEEPSIQDVSNAVISIRKQKLPDPKELGNSGSFFKNPIIPIAKFKKLQLENPEMPCYPLNMEEVKVPAGWLIEKSNLKGYRIGDAGVHKNQALVLVNYGTASGQDILNLAYKVIETVDNKFEIQLEPEVNII